MRKNKSLEAVRERERERERELHFNEVKGITLIALIVTIIVLLILAGITVATLTGDNRLNNQNK